MAKPLKNYYSILYHMHRTVQSERIIGKLSKDFLK